MEDNLVFGIKKETLEALLNYLGKRPLEEVYDIFTELRFKSISVRVSPPPVADDGEEDCSIGLTD